MKDTFFGTGTFYGAVVCAPPTACSLQDITITLNNAALTNVAPGSFYIADAERHNDFYYHQTFFVPEDLRLTLYNEVPGPIMGSGILLLALVVFSLKNKWGRHVDFC